METPDRDLPDHCWKKLPRVEIEAVEGGGQATLPKDSQGGPQSLQILGVDGSKGGGEREQAA